MRGIRTLLLAAALLLPASALAVPVSIDLYGWASYLDQANGCAQDGFHICGNSLAQVEGTFSADRDGQLLSGITGDLNILGVDYAVSGSLDFGAGTVGGVAGTLTVGGLSTFEFWNESIAGEANSLDGNDLRLWGQNFARYAATPLFGLGIHLEAAISDTDDQLFRPIDEGGQVPAVPEPGAAAVFGLGTLLVMSRRRRA